VVVELSGYPLGREVYSPEVDDLIIEVLRQLDTNQAEAFKRTLPSPAEVSPAALEVLEVRLRTLLEDLRRQARERGWEVD